MSDEGRQFDATQIEAMQRVVQAADRLVSYYLPLVVARRVLGHMPDAYKQYGELVMALVDYGQSLPLDTEQTP